MDNNEMILLVRGAKHKDPQCQLALIEGFRPLIISMIRRYVYETDALEDYMSEGAVILLNSIDTYDESLGVPFSGYLKKELFYYFVNLAKKHQNFFSLNDSGDDDSASMLETLADPVDIEGDYVHCEELLALRIYLPRLRERQRWIIEEHYDKNRSFREIGTAIGASPNSLVKLHRRAIQDLRTHFGLHLIN